jgi:hypothetical protein
MALETQHRTTYAVLDEDGHVVVLLQGADAWPTAQEWIARGYRAEAVPDDESFHADVA